MLNPKQLATATKIAKDLIGKSLSRGQVRPLEEPGRVNLVFNVADELILRMSHAKTAKDTYLKEKWCIEQARSHGVKVPLVISIGELNGFAFMALERICGRRGDQLGEGVEVLWERLGQYAQRINKVKVNGYGKRFLDAQDLGSRSWAAWVDAEIQLVRSLEHKLLQVLTAEQIASSRAAVEKLYDFEFVPVLCHANIGGTNAIVESTGDIYLIDWGGAGGYWPYWDLAEVCSWRYPMHPHIQHFMRGLGVDKHRFYVLSEEIQSVVCWRCLTSLCWVSQQQKEWTSLGMVKWCARKIDRIFS